MRTWSAPGRPAAAKQPLASEYFVSAACAVVGSTQRRGERGHHPEPPHGAILDQGGGGRRQAARVRVAGASSGGEVGGERGRLGGPQRRGGDADAGRGRVAEARAGRDGPARGEQAGDGVLLVGDRDPDVEPAVADRGDAVRGERGDQRAAAARVDRRRLLAERERSRRRPTASATVALDQRRDPARAERPGGPATRRIVVASPASDGEPQVGAEPLGGRADRRPSGRGPR